MSRAYFVGCCPAPPAITVATPPAQPSVSFSYSSGSRSNPVGSGSSYSYSSANFVLDLGGHTNIAFNGNADDVNFLAPAGSTVVGSFDGTTVHLQIPVNSLVFQVDAGSGNEPEVVTDGSHTANLVSDYTPAGATTALTAAGFTMATWGTAVPISTLRSLGLIDAYGYLNFMVVTCPSSGYGSINITSVSLS